MNAYRIIAELLFIFFILVTFTGGYFAVKAKYIMNAVMGLAVSLLGIAGLYFHLGSPFLAMMQVLIYVGAVCIIIAFGIMVGPKPQADEERRVLGKRNVLLAGAACLLGFGLLTVTVVEATWVPAAVRTGDLSIAFLGENLLYQFCLSFELISVILLTAIIGALIIANIGREESGS
jgi:NADH-quinone oxidoreductase subunit J